MIHGVRIGVFFAADYDRTGWIAMLKRHWWLLATTTIFAAGAANAQSPAPDLDKVDRMQRQMEQLQDQMKQVESDLAEAKKKVAAAKAAEAKANVPAAFNGAYGADLKPFPAKAPSILDDRVKLTWGGYLAASTVYRQHNAVMDEGMQFGLIPYPFSPQYGENEFHGSARQTRISLLVEGVLDPVQKLSGYYDLDFLGVGVTSNYNQSNSWAPRTRQLYFTYDNTEWGLHFLAGQAWSLLTMNTVGITPRSENTRHRRKPTCWVRLYAQLAVARCQGFRLLGVLRSLGREPRRARIQRYRRRCEWRQCRRLDRQLCQRRQLFPWQQRIRQSLRPGCCP
jgi:hypothetical protein